MAVSAWDAVWQSEIMASKPVTRAAAIFFLCIIIQDDLKIILMYF